MSLPGNVAPLANLKEAIKAIQKMNGERGALRHGIEEGHSPWFEFASKSYSIDRKMSVIACLTGVLETDMVSQSNGSASINVCCR